MAGNSPAHFKERDVSTPARESCQEKFPNLFSAVPHLREAPLVAARISKNGPGTHAKGPRPLDSVRLLQIFCSVLAVGGSLLYLNMTDSQSLLADYAQNRSESAFGAIVTQYLDLVYSSAFRLLDGDTHRAKDVAQIVFADLARKAGELSPDVMLGGWLHRHTCFVAVNLQRTERRRLAREREAVEMKSLHADVSLDFSSLAPVLDESINQLAEADRIAILLRFFEQKDFRSVGQSLETSEDAARMRVNRALDKLREILAQRGIQTTAATLGIIVSANAIQAAPAGLALAVSTAALAGTTLAVTAASTTTKAIALTAFQKTIISTTIVVLAGAGIYEARQAAKLRDRVLELQQQQVTLIEHVRQLEAGRDGESNRIAELQGELTKTTKNAAELLKLRGEVGLLRRHVAELESLPPRSASNNLMPIKPALNLVEYGLDPTFLPKLQEAMSPMPGESNQDLLARYFKENKLELQSPATMIWDERKNKLLVRAPRSDQDRIEILFTELLKTK